MKKRILSVLMALCMVLSLAPTMAFAANASSVTISGQELTSSKPYYHNGTSSNPEGTANDDPEGADAVFDASTGTLTLKGLHVNDGSISWTSNADLKIVLAKGTKNTIVKTNGSAIMGNGNIANNSEGASLVITTDNETTSVENAGELYAVSSGVGCGIWVWEDITIEGYAKV
ncbi:MAG: hypothetical protein IJM95_10115, partial [Anaerotignum sp.]|nr:hypothetical protein [Anaerotignum sp.]